MHNYFYFFVPNTHCALVDVYCRKKASTISYGYRKWGTQARVFSQTLAHGNSKNEIEKETDEDGKKRGVSKKRSKAGTKKKKSRRPILS